MSDSTKVNEMNVEGAWFVTDPDAEDQGCISCGICYAGAPEFFAEDESGAAYVKKQPATEDEAALCQEQREACPVEAIGTR